MRGLPVNQKVACDTMISSLAFLFTYNVHVFCVQFPSLIDIVDIVRSRSSVLQCSRCASVISMAASRVNSRPSSQMSLLLDKKLPRGPGGGEKEIQCKICLYDCPQTLMVKLEDCGCAFCREVRLEPWLGIIFVFSFHFLLVPQTIHHIRGDGGSVRHILSWSPLSHPG